MSPPIQTTKCWGAGGTIARRVREGHEVYIAILGEGITSRYADREDADAGLLDSLHSDSAKVGELLGAKDVFLYGLPDNRFDTVPLLDAVKIVEELVDKVRPDTIFTQHPGDLNVDHGVVFRAVMTGTRPTAGQVVKTVYAFEVASSTEWAFQRVSPPFRPNAFFDIQDTLELKIEAMELYESEKRPFPHPRSPESLRAIAQRWGSAVGFQAAEAFELMRYID